jgi:asparagine synthase (glutamine-hydrolysing)
MCGIAGAISFHGTVREEPVLRMRALQAHRGPDALGLWRSPDGRCVLAHNRLAVIDLSDAGLQPMLDPTTGNTVVYNGEIYNFRELRRDCEKNGRVFRSHTDTEVLLALYALYGEEMVDRLKGMFAFALWDANRKRLFLARDRMGEKPLYYAQTGDTFLFASELRALASHPEMPREIDPEALDLFFQFQCVPAPWTIYRDARKLPPAHAAVFDESGLRISRYWRLDYTNKIAINEQDAVDALEEKIIDSIRLQRLADVPVGTALSGGVDSGLLTALTAQQSADRVKTFTIAFREKDKDESEYALAVSERYNTEHHVLTVESDIQSLLPRIVRHHGEPFGDSSAIPTFHLAEFARSQVTVLLTGDGGDEILGGYHRYSLPDWRTKLSPLLDTLRKPGAAAATIMERGHTLPKPLKKLLFRYIHPEYRGLLYSHLCTHPVRRGLLGELSTDAVTRHVAGRLEEAVRYSRFPADRLMFLDSSMYLPDDLLVKTDIASMHCSLETRIPFLDHEIVEFCASLPPLLKTKGRTPKYLLKKVAERHLPHDVIYRPKMGFSIPLKQWLLGPLKGYLLERLRNPELMEPLRMPAVALLTREFYDHGVDHSQRLWLLLIYALWREQVHLEPRS